MYSGTFLSNCLRSELSRPFLNVRGSVDIITVMNAGVWKGWDTFDHLVYVGSRWSLQQNM